MIHGASLAATGGVAQAADPPILVVEDIQKVDETLYVYRSDRNTVRQIDPTVLTRESNPIVRLDCVSTPGPATSKAEFKSAVIQQGVQPGIVFC